MYLYTQNSLQSHLTKHHGRWLQHFLSKWFSSIGSRSATWVPNSRHARFGWMGNGEFFFSETTALVREVSPIQLQVKRGMSFFSTLKAAQHQFFFK